MPTDLLVAIARRYEASYNKAAAFVCVAPTLRPTRSGSLPDLRAPTAIVTSPTSPSPSSPSSPPRGRRSDCATAPTTPASVVFSLRQQHSDGANNDGFVLTNPAVVALSAGGDGGSHHTVGLSPDPKLWRGVMLDSTSTRLSDSQMGRHLSGSVDFGGQMSPTSVLPDPMEAVPLVLQAAQEPLVPGAMQSARQPIQVCKRERACDWRGVHVPSDFVLRV